MTGDQRQPEAVNVTEDFMALASHELRSPLTSVLGFSARLRRLADKGEFSESVAQQLTLIHAEARRMQQTLDLFTRLSTIDTGQFQANPQDVDMAELVTAETTLTRRDADGSEIELVIDDDASLVVQTDGDHMRGVIASLLSNAVNYGGDPQRIVVAVRRDDDDVLVTVSDNGDGVAAEDAPHVFERFYRSSRPPARRRGLGLGLFVAYETALRLGAALTLESAPGEGAEFQLRLPATWMH